MNIEKYDIFFIYHKSITYEMNKSNYKTFENNPYDNNPFNDDSYDDYPLLKNKNNVLNDDLNDELDEGKIIIDRQNNINKIVVEVTEVKDLFHQVYKIADYQGPMIDDIESNITFSTNHINKANDELKIISKKQKKCLCCEVSTFWCLFGLVLIILLTLFFIVLFATIKTSGE